MTLGSIQDPADIHRTYEDIEAILRVNQVRYKTEETRTKDGKFKSYIVDTRG